MSKEEHQMQTNRIRSTNWEGLVPVVLSLAPTSLSSPTMPPPIHKMVSRQTYLHVGLTQEVRKLYKFAPMSFRSLSVNFGTRSMQEEPSPEMNKHSDGVTEDEKSSNAETSESQKKNNDFNQNYNENEEDEYPICWFEDEETGTPLRWHLFTGILYDLLSLKKTNHESKMSNGSKMPLLPWKVRVHFTSYPTTQLLQFSSTIGSSNANKLKDKAAKSTPQVQVMHTIYQIFSNSLKQALYLQHGSNRIAMNMSKQSHIQLWDAVLRNKWEMYREVNSSLQCSVTMAKQPETNNNGDDSHAGDNFNGSTSTSSLQRVPIRIMVDSKPARAISCSPFRTIDGKEKRVTLGEVLTEWLPELFPMDICEKSVEDEKKSLPYDGARCRWSIQGIQISYDCPIVDVWNCLCHPDHFLYITVVKMQ